MSNIRKKISVGGAPSPVWSSEVGNTKADSVTRTKSPKEIKEKLESVRSGLETDITTLVSRLGGSPLIFDENRFTIVKNFLLLSYLIGEVNILFATVWRYSFVEPAWNVLAPLVFDAVGDVESMRENGESLIQTGVDITSVYFKGLMKNYSQFFIWFDSSLEPRISEFGELTPFEIRLIDVLSCGPTIDFELVLTKPDRKSNFCHLHGTYKILNLPCVYDVPDFSKNPVSSLSKQSKVINYVRDFVRRDNVVYLQKIINSLSVSECQLPFLNELEKLDKMRSLCVDYERVLGELYQLPVHSSHFTELGENKYYHDVYKRQLRADDKASLVVTVTVPILPVKHLPLILSKSSGRTSSDNTSLTRKDCASFVSKLKDYSQCCSRTTKPEAVLKLNYNDCSGDVSEIVLVCTYGCNNEFCVLVKETSVEPENCFDVPDE